MTDERLRQIIAELQGWLEERQNAEPRYYTPTIPWEQPPLVNGCQACAGSGICGCVRPENTPQSR